MTFAGSVKPDEIYIGRWPYFHGVLWDVNPVAFQYTDSAILLKWKPVELEANRERDIATIYGLHTQRKTGLRVLFNTKMKTESTTILFDINSSTLTKESKEKINEILLKLSEEEILGVIVNGHTDYPGSEMYNLRLSKRRAMSVKQYLIRRGIQGANVIPKAWGESRAEQKEVRQSVEVSLPNEVINYLDREAKRNDRSRNEHLQYFIESRIKSILGIKVFGNPADRRAKIQLQIREDNEER